MNGRCFQWKNWTTQNFQYGPDDLHGWQMKAIHIKPLTPSVPPVDQHVHTRTRTRKHTQSIFNTSSSQSPKTNGQTSNTYMHKLKKTEWEGGWERRERLSVVYWREREADLNSSRSLSPSFLLHFFFKTDAQSSSREKYPALGLHLLLWGFIWVLSHPVCKRVHVCGRELVQGMKDMGRCQIAPRI